MAITKFGCTIHRGAADLGARTIFVVERDNAGGARPRGDYIGDKAGQARYLTELLEIFTAAGVDSAFWFIFADDTLPHRDDLHEDVDIASYGVVQVLEGRLGDAYPDMPWVPKAAPTALADHDRG